MARKTPAPLARKLSELDAEQAQAAKRMELLRESIESGDAPEEIEARRNAEHLARRPLGAQRARQRRRLWRLLIAVAIAAYVGWRFLN